MNSWGTLGKSSYDRRDAEIARLKREVEVLRERERTAHAEAEDARRHFAELTAMSKRFASSMRAGATERQQYRRRLAAQYAVSRVLAEAQDLDEAGPRIFEVFGERLGWYIGILWTLDRQAGVLRRGGIWRRREDSPGAMEKACEDMEFRRGKGLPGRVWEREEPVWVEDVLEDEDFVRTEVAEEEGLRGALAFPIRNGGFAGVFELFQREVLPPDEDLLRTAALIGDQIGQFLQRRRAEETASRAAEQDRYRVALADALRPLTDPAEIQSEAMRILGEHLEVDRVFYCEITEDQQSAVFTDNYVRDDYPKLLDRLPLSDFGESAEKMRAGETLLIADVRTDAAVSEAVRASFLAVDATAILVVPLIKAGQWVAALGLHSGTPREWTANEIALLNETAERTWAAIERAHAEEALRESEDRYRTLFTSMDEGYAVVEVMADESGVWNDFLFLEVNPAFEKQTGMVDPVGRTATEILGTPNPAWAQTYGRVAETGEPVRFEENEPTLGRDFDLYAFRLGGEGSHRVAVLFTDITRRKKAEQALRESEERLQKAISIETVGVLFFNLDGQITDANEAFARMTGYTRDELLGSVHWEVLTAPEFTEATERAAEELAVNGETNPYEKQFLRKDGSRWWALCAPRRLSGSGRGSECVEFILDITERKEAEEERERYLAREWQVRAAAEERKRISRELHDRVAHSMGVVHQSLELYEVFKECNPSQAEAKMKLAKETTRETLDLTRNISRELHDTEVKDGLSAALSNLLKTTIPPGIESSVSVRGDESFIPPRVREQLFLIIREAIRNATSHSGASRLSIVVRISSENVVGRVEDDGRGFKEESEGAAGPGRGIDSMRERAELVEGTLRLSSAPGKGTKIEASIPLNGVELGAKQSNDGGRAE